MAFGRLYQWLQFNSNDKPFGPIREVVREFILDNFPIQPGIDLLGTPLTAGGYTLFKASPRPPVIIQKRSTGLSFWQGWQAVTQTNRILEWFSTLLMAKI
ncbi:hypothetical protein ACFSHQ_06595 [Gemmobacter lanyuensis]